LRQKMAATILSGDGPLRKVAKQLRYDIRGVLWIFDQLVNNGIVTPMEAASRLAAIRIKGARLPDDECERRIRQWMNQ